MVRMVRRVVEAVQIDFPAPDFDMFLRRLCNDLDMPLPVLTAARRIAFKFPMRPLSVHDISADATVLPESGPLAYLIVAAKLFFCICTSALSLVAEF